MLSTTYKIKKLAEKKSPEQSLDQREKCHYSYHEVLPA